ncbi:glycosyltransferase [Flavobacterium silvaticum]|uniref:Glycosyltransferase n=1 Tax=Flavobacterium silvaticum TaxID=1852020 RepID=A0A972FW51_9FLAO|nr:glycosyltransferase [Flavobacterium silvaticum]NMH29122.1 glycosyltransferase [Flavobacterium silvaticum]
MLFSVIVPVYNRPEEIREFLESLLLQDFDKPFEVVIVEDGSTFPCWSVVQKYFDRLKISYYNKTNSGPGDSRNFGMKKAEGDYFLIFDSDCIIPPHYLKTVSEELATHYVDCFGGPDAALPSFSNVQKAINFAMTSIVTTGGIRGGSEKLSRFQPRSFNMGLSKVAFEKSGGFGNIHPGEDPDLSIRLWKMGIETRLFPSAFVYHKRRIDWGKFYKQVNKFGKARPILDSWYPEFSKVTYWMPSLFLIGVLASVVLFFLGFPYLLYATISYFMIALLIAILSTKSLTIGVLAIIAISIQFYGYGTGFLKSYINVRVLKKRPHEVFPELFFKST